MYFNKWGQWKICNSWHTCQNKSFVDVYTVKTALYEVSSKDKLQWSRENPMQRSFVEREMMLHSMLLYKKVRQEGYRKSEVLYLRLPNRIVWWQWYSIWRQEQDGLISRWRFKRACLCHSWGLFVLLRLIRREDWVLWEAIGIGETLRNHTRKALCPFATPLVAKKYFVEWKEHLAVKLV